MPPRREAPDPLSGGDRRTVSPAVRRLVAGLLSAVAVGAMVQHYAHVAAPGWLAIAAYLGFCVAGQGLFRLRERLLLSVAVALTLLEFLFGSDAPATVHRALEQASFLAAFMLLLGVLKEAAASSPAVIACGRYLTRQPPGRRYSAIAGGAHILTVLLNFGSLSLLSPLVQAGVRAGREAGDPDWIAAIKERRQMSALVRGFAVAIVWAPTTVTQAILISLFPATDTLLVLLAGLGLAALCLTLGWTEDRLRWLRVRRRLQREGKAPVYGRDPAPRTAFRDFALVSASLIGLAAAIRLLTGVETVPALMLASPILTLAWIYRQSRGHGWRVAAGATARRAVGIVGRAVPASSPEALTLSTAGYIGIMLAALVPGDLVAAVASPEVLPPALLLILLPAVIILATQVALTAIVMVVFIGSALGGLDPLPLPPDLMVIAMAGGWAISLTASPFAAGALIISRMTGLSPFDMTWRWNGLYSLLAYLLLAAWLLVLLQLR